MIALNMLAIVDPDVGRRAGLTHALASAGIHAEPMSQIEELDELCTTPDLLLAFDNEDSAPKIVRHLETSKTWIPFLMYASSTVPENIFDAAKFGSVGYLVLPLEVNDLLETCVKGIRYAEEVSKRMTALFESRGRVASLTCREREVLRMIGQGYSARETAKLLGISHRTIEIHKHGIMTKLAAKNSAHAIAIACHAGIITLDDVEVDK